MKKDKELRQKLAARFDDFEAEPRPETWENIRLAVQKKRRRRAAFFLWLSAGVLLLGGGGLLLFGQQKRRAEDIRPRQAVVKPAAIARTAEPTYKPAPALSERPDRGDKTLFVVKVPPLRPRQRAVANTHAVTEAVPLAAFPATPPPAKAIASLAVMSGAAEHRNAAAGLAGLPALALKPLVAAIPVLPAEPVIPVVSAPGIPPKREQGLILGIALHSAYQLMQGQQVGDKSSGNIGLLPGFDGRRLGFSVAAAYRVPLGRRGDVQFGAAYFNLPLRASYDLLSGHQTQVNVQSGGDYTVAPAVVGHVSSEKRLQALGLSLEGGYEFRLLGLPTRAYAGGEIRAVFRLRQPGIWTRAGWEIACGRGGLSVGPFLDYQLGAGLSDDGFLKTRLYAVGLGARMLLLPAD